MEPPPPINRVHLSKSRLTAFEQCAKRLWLEVHKRELAVFDEDSKAAFQRGHEVGAIALRDYPDGVMIGEDGDLGRALVLLVDKA